MLIHRVVSSYHRMPCTVPVEQVPGPQEQKSRWNVDLGITNELELQEAIARIDEWASKLPAKGTYHSIIKGSYNTKPLSTELKLLW